MKKIPKIIHQIWWQGIDKLPDKYAKYSKSWVKYHPYWTITYWDKNNIYKLINTYYSNLLKLINKYPYMIQKIDLAKYIILYHYGGFYIDMDTICHQSLNNLFNNPEYQQYDFICSQMEIIPFIKIINNGVIFSKPKHNLLLLILNSLHKHIDKRFYQNQDYYILESTGPIFFNNIINDFYQDTILILPHNFLESCNLLDYQKCKKQGTYMTHHHTLSWSTSYFKLLFKILSLLNQYKLFILIICILIVLTNKIEKI